MMSNCASVIEGSIQWRMRSKTELVCSAEKESVDMTKMITDQMRAGHHARSQDGIRNWARRGCTSGKFGAGRGLRQGWRSDKENGSVLIEYSLLRRLKSHAGQP